MQSERSAGTYANVAGVASKTTLDRRGALVASATQAVLARQVRVARRARLSSVTRSAWLDTQGTAARRANSARRAKRATQASQALVARFAPRVNAAHEAIGYSVASQKACRA